VPCPYRRRHDRTCVRCRSSSSMSVTYGVCCRHTLSITTEAGRISRWQRIAQSLGPYSHPPQAPLLHFRRSAACTIATSVAQRELLQVTKPQPVRGRGSSRSAIASLGCHGAPNPCMVPRSQKRTKLCSNNRGSSAAHFVGKLIS
jgi:hypothetical protein